jgi:hypothetical protein
MKPVTSETKTGSGCVGCQGTQMLQSLDSGKLINDLTELSKSLPTLQTKPSIPSTVASLPTIQAATDPSLLSATYVPENKLPKSVSSSADVQQKINKLASASSSSSSSPSASTASYDTILKNHRQSLEDASRQTQVLLKTWEEKQREQTKQFEKMNFGNGSAMPAQLKSMMAQLNALPQELQSKTQTIHQQLEKSQGQLQNNVELLSKQAGTMEEVNEIVRRFKDVHPKIMNFAEKAESISQHLSVNFRDQGKMIGSLLNDDTFMVPKLNQSLRPLWSPHAQWVRWSEQMQSKRDLAQEGFQLVSSETIRSLSSQKGFIEWKSCSVQNNDMILVGSTFLAPSFGIVVASAQIGKDLKVEFKQVKTDVFDKEATIHQMERIKDCIYLLCTSQRQAYLVCLKADDLSVLEKRKLVPDSTKDSLAVRMSVSESLQKIAVVICTLNEEAGGMVYSVLTVPVSSSTSSTVGDTKTVDLPVNYIVNDLTWTKTNVLNVCGYVEGSSGVGFWREYDCILRIQKPHHQALENKLPFGDSGSESGCHLIWKPQTEEHHMILASSRYQMVVPTRFLCDSDQNQVILVGTFVDDQNRAIGFCLQKPVRKLIVMRTSKSSDTTIIPMFARFLGRRIEVVGHFLSDPQNSDTMRPFVTSLSVDTHSLSPVIDVKPLCLPSHSYQVLHHSDGSFYVGTQQKGQTMHTREGVILVKK